MTADRRREAYGTSSDDRRDVLSLAFGDDAQRVVGQWPLQSKSVSRRLGRKPEVNLAGVSQDDRHCLRMDGRDDRVGFRRQESEKLVLAFDRRALGPADASPGRPEAGEGEERAILAERDGPWAFVRITPRVVLIALFSFQRPSRQP